MTMTVNDEAVRHAEDLIGTGNWRLNTVWDTAKPSSSAEQTYLAENGWDELAKWYLALDTGANGATHEQLAFPYGDFTDVHRSGLLAARARAEKGGYDAVVDAVDTLLDLFDRFNSR